jgi:hypothetical protein
MKMLLKVSVSRDGEFISEKLINDSKDHSKDIDQICKLWAKEMAKDFQGKGESL